MKKSILARAPFYYGWVNLAFAAIAMVATLPGRSVGIGLITEPLLDDMSISRVAFGQMNFWATLIGASFNLLCGPAVDRFGVRLVLSVVLFALCFVVSGLSFVTGAVGLVLLLILVRGIGQSALSVVSLTIVGKWFVRRLSMAMAIFAVLMSLGFVAAIVMTENAVLAHGWRTVWFDLGWILAMIALLSFLFVRASPESVGLMVDSGTDDAADEGASESGFTLNQALRTPAFWVFAVGSGLYNLVIAGVLLFNQSILEELGFDAMVFRNAMAAFMFTGLIGNFSAGWAARRWSLGRLMTVAMLIVTFYLLLFPELKNSYQAVAHASLLGLSGGVVSVIFFTAWGKVFGRPHLGKIQGAAQVFTVFASAIGPWFVAFIFDAFGTYSPAFYSLAPLLFLVAIAGWFVRIPDPVELVRAESAKVA